MIHPTAIIFPGVVFEDESKTYVGPYCVIGGPPEHRQYYDDSPGKGVIISAGARLYSHVTIDAGTVNATKVGADSVVFNHSHIAHDCILGRKVTIGGHVTLAGHTFVMDGATVSGKSATFQWTVIGAYSFVGGMSYVTKHVGLSERHVGIPARFVGYNDIGLGRCGITHDQVITRYLKHYERLTNDRTPR